MNMQNINIEMAGMQQPPVDMPTRRSIHQPFSWLPQSAQDNQVACSDAAAMDAFRGIETCLQLVEMSNLDREMAENDNNPEIVPVLSMADTSRLMRLAILVAHEWAHKYETLVTATPVRKGD